MKRTAEQLEDVYFNSLETTMDDILFNNASLENTTTCYSITATIDTLLEINPENYKRIVKIIKDKDIQTIQNNLSKAGIDAPVYNFITDARELYPITA